VNSPPSRRAGRIESVSDALQRHVDAGDAAGLVAVVARGDDVEVTVLGAQAVGGAPMREDSLFRIASAGKPIVAAATLALVADGQLRLDEPVDDILPELAAPRVLRELLSPLDDTVAAVRSITVRDLLCSTNGHGFPSDFSAPVVARLTDDLHQGSSRLQAVPGPDEWMATLATIPLLHQPGEAFTYNTAYDILGVLIARVSGRSFPHYVNERILQPLAMNDTGFCFPPGSSDRATTSYRRGDDGDLTIVDTPDGQWAIEPDFASGAGGYVSTAADLLAFHRMLLAGGADVLPRPLVDAMTSDQLTPAIRATDTVFLDGQSWGYGGGVDIALLNPWNVIGRYGWVGGTGTSAYHVPTDGTIAIVLTQTELGGPAGAPILETFWTAAATALDHHT
jgi:CubicO group peptidase (beta-lactamase class C family)